MSKGGKLLWCTLPKFSPQSTEKKRSWLKTLNQVVKGGGSHLAGKINIYLLQLGALWMSHHAGCKGIKLVGPGRVERVGVEGGGERQRAVNTFDELSAILRCMGTYKLLCKIVRLGYDDKMLSAGGQNSNTVVFKLRVIICCCIVANLNN